MKRFQALFVSTSLLVAIGFVPSTRAADWPQWRGPDRADHSPDTGLLKSWPEGGPKRVWLNENAGLGYSGYSIVGGKLFTMGLRGDTEFLIALDADSGKELWATKVGEKYSNNWGDGPRGTPTVDGDRVYALSGQGTLIAAQTADGKELWSVSMTKDLGGKLQGWGYTESVLVDGERVICTPGGSQGTMAALDKMTGKVLWRTTDLQDEAQYSSSIIAHPGGAKQYVQLVAKRFFGVDPDSGKVVWQSDFPGRTAVIPTPIAAGDQVYVTAGYGAGCKAVKATSSDPAVVYQNKVMKNHHGGVVLVGDYLYGHSDGYAWVCQNWKTGEEVWANRNYGKGAIHYADGMLYCLEESSGTVALVEASPEGWKEHGRLKLEPQSTKRSPQGRIWTHPVVVNGKLYLRDQELLFCYDVKGS